MDAENNDDDQNDSSSRQGGEETPSSKLRDLRPEKDPMGGGKTVTQAAGSSVAAS